MFGSREQYVANEVSGRVRGRKRSIAKTISSLPLCWISCDAEPNINRLYLLTSLIVLGYNPIFHDFSGILKKYINFNFTPFFPPLSGFSSSRSF